MLFQLDGGRRREGNKEVKNKKNNCCGEEGFP
jgi:hypothetical protein